MIAMPTHAIVAAVEMKRPLSPSPNIGIAVQPTMTSSASRAVCARNGPDTLPRLRGVKQPPTNAHECVNQTVDREIACADGLDRRIDGEEPHPLLREHCAERTDGPGDNSADRSTGPANPDRALR